MNNIHSEFETWARNETPMMHVFSFTRMWDHPHGERYLELATELAFRAYKAAKAAQQEALVKGFQYDHIVQAFEQICGYDLTKDLNNEYIVRETQDAFRWLKNGIDFALGNIRSRNEDLETQVQQEPDDPKELQRELFELLVKAARRCNYDLNHAADNIADETLREMFRKRFAMWKAIFDPANGIKDYRSKLYMQNTMLEVKLERAIELLDKNKIDHDIDLEI